MLRIRTVFLGCAFVLTLGSVAQAELITNGSFETPIITADSCKTYATVNNWSVAAGGISLVAGRPSGWGANVAAEAGSQFLILNAAGAGGTITQSLTTTVGTTYELTFSYCAFSNGNNKTAHLIYHVGNVVSDTLAIDTTGVSTKLLTGWLTKTISFVATSTSTTLSFGGNDISTNPGALYGVALDNVACAAVPEPSTTVLWLGATMSGLLAFAWRKRRKN